MNRRGFLGLLAFAPLAPVEAEGPVIDPTFEVEVIGLPPQLKPGWRRTPGYRRIIDCYPDPLPSPKGSARMTSLPNPFENVGRQFTDPAAPTPATAASESATNAVAEPFELASDPGASWSGSQLSDARNELAYSLPDIPDFLDRRRIA